MCTGCQPSTTNTAKYWTVCECCKRVDNDNGEKFTVFCHLCNAYICESCSKDWGKRILAFGDKVKEKIINFVKT